MQTKLVIMISLTVKIMLQFQFFGTDPFCLTDCYGGLQYQANPQAVLLFFGGAALYCFWFMGRYDSYFHNFGIYILTRQKKKSCVIGRMLYWTIRDVLFLKAYELILFFAGTLLWSEEWVSVPPILLLRLWLQNFLMTLLLICVQMGMELAIRDKTAVIAALSYYSLSVLASDRLFLLQKGEWLNGIFFINIAYESRRSAWEEPVVVYGVALVWILLLAGCFAAYFRKKDVMF